MNKNEEESFMIEYTKGNILEANVQAIVNTVNTVGIMGKGLALEVKTRWPKVYNVYKKACNLGLVCTGKMQVVSTGIYTNNPKWIINFPTKQHWRNPSKLEWIEEGLKDLSRIITAYSISSIAIPKLGCGLGGLN